MLQSIKSSIASPWLRYSLFGILILSFGVWGIGDVLRRLVSPAAEVLVEGEGIELDRQAFAQQWQRATATFRAQGLTSQQLLAGPLPRLVLDRLLGQALLQQAAEGLRLQVPSSVLQKTIAQEPLFAGEDGRFASWRFISFLRQTGLSEQAYLQELQARLVQSSLLESLSFNLTLPDPFLRKLMALQQEQRELQVLTLPLPALKTIRDPGDDALKTFMQKEQALFRLPEYRRFAYATLALEPETSLDLTLVRSYYEERKQELREEEKRSFLQLFFLEEEDARNAETALKSGAKLNEIAAKFSTTPLPVQAQAREDMLDDAIANSVFAADMQQKGDLAVTKGGLGWYLLRLEGIVPMRVPAFDSVREDLTRRLLQERAAQRYADAVSQAEDMLFAGASLQEVAETLGLTLQTTPLVDTEKFLTDGTKAPPLWRKLKVEEERELLTLGFALSAEAEVSQAFEIEGEDGRIQAMFLELRERQEARLADLSQKRPAVLAVFRDLTRREQTQQRAKKLAEDAQKSAGAGQQEGQEGLANLARREGLTLSKRTLARKPQATSQFWDADFLDSLFKAREGDVLTARFEGGELIVRLASVRRPSVLSFSSEEVEEFAEKLAAENALPLSSYRQALQRQAKLRINEEAFKAFIATGLAP